MQAILGLSFLDNTVLILNLSLMWQNFRWDISHISHKWLIFFIYNILSPYHSTHRSMIKFKLNLIKNLIKYSWYKQREDRNIVQFAPRKATYDHKRTIILSIVSFNWSICTYASSRAMISDIPRAFAQILYSESHLMDDVCFGIEKFHHRWYDSNTSNSTFHNGDIYLSENLCDFAVNEVENGNFVNKPAAILDFSFDEHWQVA